MHDREEDESSTSRSVPISLQIRALMLGWCLLLDLVSECNDNKRIRIIQYIREFDILSPFCHHLVENLLIAGPALWSYLGEDKRKKKEIGVTHEMCLGHGPKPHVRLSAQMRRLFFLRSAPDEWSEDEECIYYSQLSSFLFLRALRFLPALTRMWWTSCNRSAGVSAFHHFSVLLNHP